MRLSAFVSATTSPTPPGAGIVKKTPTQEDEEVLHHTLPVFSS